MVIALALLSGHREYPNVSDKNLGLGYYKNINVYEHKNNYYKNLNVYEYKNNYYKILNTKKSNFTYISLHICAITNMHRQWYINSESICYPVACTQIEHCNK